MRLLDRYLLREFLVPLGYCLGGFLILWVAFDLFSVLHDMQEKQLLARDIVEFYVFKSPEFLILVLPIGLLLALLYTLTNLARHNEIIAIRAAGTSMWRLSLPFLAVGFAASVLLMLLNEFCVPKTSGFAEQILLRRVQRQVSAEEKQQVKNLVFHNARENRFWRVGVYNQQTGEMFKPQVEWRLPDGSWRSIFADRASRTNGSWTFFHVREFKQLTATNSLLVPLPQADVLVMPGFTETLEEIKSEINVTDTHDRPTRTRRAEIPVAQILNFLRLHPNPQASIRPWIYTKLHGRFAGPCACLVVVLVAIPFATASGRRNVFVGVAASIFIFFVYYLLQQLGFAFGEAGRVPAWLGAWLPNLFFGIAGLWMLTRVR